MKNFNWDNFKPGNNGFIILIGLCFVGCLITVNVSDIIFGVFFIGFVTTIVLAVIKRKPNKKNDLPQKRPTFNANNQANGQTGETAPFTAPNVYNFESTAQTVRMKAQITELEKQNAALKKQLDEAKKKQSNAPKPQFRFL